MSERPAPRRRRPYQKPAIVMSAPAFEHAILTCNGKPDGGNFCTANRKGGCIGTTGCTANS